MSAPTNTTEYPLTEANDAFCIYLAKRFVSRHTLRRLGFADLVQEARIGMMTAERRFDPGRGAKFVSYAAHYVWRYMQRAADGFDDLVPAPSSSRRTRADIPYRRSVISLDGQVDANDPMDPAELHTALQTTPPADTTPSLTYRDIVRELEPLTPRQRTVLILRAAGVTLRDLGDRLGVSRERIRQIEAEAQHELRQRRNPVKPGTRKQTEKRIQADILAEFGSKSWCRLWRQNTGRAVPVYAAGKPNPPIIAFGLPGSADLSGILADGRRLEIEVKSHTGKQSQQQRNFEAMIRNLGGVYILAHSVDDVWKGLAEYGFDPDPAAPERPTAA